MVETQSAAWRAKADGKATEEQLATVKAQAKGLEEGPKSCRAAAAAAAAAAGRQLMRCCGTACTETGPEGARHRYTEDGKRNRYRLPL